MPAALPIAIGASAAGGVAGSAIGAGAAGDAADKQAAAGMYASNLQKQIYDQQRQDQSPWRQGGLQAMYGPGGLFTRMDPNGTGNGGGNLQTDWTAKRLQALKDERQRHYENIQESGGQFGFGAQEMTDAARKQYWDSQPDSALEKQAASDWGTMGVKETAGQVDGSLYQVDPELTRRFGLSDFQKDPGYDFRMQEGQKALERSAAARGGLQSGGFMKALGRYGQDYASGEYQNAYNRFTNDQTSRYNKLAGIAGVGQTANAGLANAGQNYANQVGQNAMGVANAQGAAGIAGANAVSQGIGSIGNLGKTWMDYSNANDYMDWLKTK